MTTGTTPLTPVLDGLWATGTSRLPYQHDVLLRSFLLERPEGNVLVYDSPGITDASDAIAARGGATRLLLTHAHESMYGDPQPSVPAYIHERDRVEAEGGMRIAGTFTERQLIDDDLEVIPAPGHTPGATCYLWTHGGRRMLFSGDVVWVERGEWKAVVLDPALRPAYIDSLEVLRGTDFDVLVPWGVTEGDPPAIVVDRGEARARIEDIIDRVRKGGNR